MSDENFGNIRVVCAVSHDSLHMTHDFKQRTLWEKRVYSGGKFDVS